MGNYRSCWHYQADGTKQKLFSVGIGKDGTLINPNGYPEHVVREAVLGADARRAERRSNGAKKAAVTRQRRQAKRTLEVANIILAGKDIGRRHKCAICNRKLDDTDSVNRGIGSECWQDVYRGSYARRALSLIAAPMRRITFS
jgi:hypothetical protein